MLFRIISLIKAVFLEPSVVFKKIYSGKISTEIYWLFSASALIVFFKTFSIQTNVHINFLKIKLMICCHYWLILMSLGF